MVEVLLKYVQDGQKYLATLLKFYFLGGKPMLACEQAMVEILLTLLLITLAKNVRCLLLKATIGERL